MRAPSPSLALASLGALALLSAVSLARADEPVPPSPPPPAPDPPTMPAVPPPSAGAADSLHHAPPGPPLTLSGAPPEPSSTPLISASVGKNAEGAVDYKTDRYEPAGLPLIGGNSDIGFQFGGVATLSHFADGIRPYAWNMDLVLSASIKDGPKGVQLVQESFLYNGDFPGLFDGKVRLNPQVQYQRTINMGYFGLGNAANGNQAGNYTGPTGRYFEWIDSISQAYVAPRFTLSGPWSINTLAGYRYMAPSAYADSKLARDAVAKNPDGSPVVRGLGNASLTQLSAGLIYDTRDNEVFVHSGLYSQLGTTYQQGFPLADSIQYGESQMLFQGYQPLGPLVLAGRFVADFQYGHVPFYDLFMSGPFGQSEAIGGGSAIRGVPVGRYSGEIKIYGNVELRSMFFQFHLLRQKISLGADALFDTGRSWLNYSFNSPLDGNGVGLKYGAGGGIYVLWGQAAIFRIDVAYSPDAQAENPSFPVGIYVNDGVSF